MAANPRTRGAMHEYTIAECRQQGLAIGEAWVLTNYHEVDVLREQFAPLHATQRDITVVLLARGLVKELVEEQEREDIGVVQ